MISVEGLQAFADQLTIQSLGRAALENAAEAMGAAIRQIIGNAWQVQLGKQQSEHATRVGDSISHHVDGNEMIVGCTSRLAMDLELGSTEHPPQSFLVAAAQAHAEEIVQIVAQTIGDGLGHNDA